MAASNRSALIVQSHKVLKKHFKPVVRQEQSVLESLLFACCLECTEPATAEIAFKSLLEKNFDLNEIRVSTCRELAESMKELSDPTEAAMRLRGALQSVFESLYEFDLESMKKQNIGQAVKTLSHYKGTTPFVVAYVTQNTLAGHSIPVNAGALESMRVVGVVSEKEAAKGTVPGLERAIPKNKGIEYGSLLHQLGVLFMANPYSADLKKILLEINPDCKAGLPKRPSKKPAKPKKPEKPVKKPAAKQPPKSDSSKKKSLAKGPAAKASTKKVPAKKASSKKASAKKASTKKAPPKKVVAKKKAPPKKKPASKTVKKKAPAKKKATSSKKLSTKKPR